MVKLILSIIFLSYSIQLLAVEAVVRVLEAPVFSRPELNSKILQYRRKGEKVYLHYSSIKNENYYNLGPDGVSDQELFEQSYWEYFNQYPDPLFKQMVYNYQDNDDFYLTLTDRFRPGFMLKEHVHVYYEDKREITQKPLVYDTTDYRIDEPLPKNYPFAKSQGFKGMLLVGSGTINRASYPFPGQVQAQNAGRRIEVQATWSKQVEIDLTNRFYFGVIGVLNTVDRQTQLVDRSGREEFRQFGVGPYASYDPYRSENYSISINFSITANIVNQLRVINDGTNAVEEVTFSRFSFTPRVGVFWQKKRIFSDFLDLVAGANISFDPPIQYTSADVGGNANWWANQNSFQSQFSLDMALFIGVQSAY